MSEVRIMGKKRCIKKKRVILVGRAFLNGPKLQGKACSLGQIMPVCWHRNIPLEGPAESEVWAVLPRLQPGQGQWQQFNQENSK